ncbi:MAG: SUMF1/EgtB/PvdO family nonheme iron enzyme [Candidatus Paceibacterota bacterium]
MSKDKKHGRDRSIKIGQDATSSVIVSGDGNVVTIGSDPAKPGTQQHRGVPKVFISSTSEDLKQHRAAARDAAISAGFLPIQMEYFAASGEHAPLEACLHKVSEADVVVVIVAHRYGWVPSDQGDGQHKSITWLECEQAKAENKEILAFLVDDAHAWPTELTEQFRMTAAIEQGKATPELLAEVLRNVEQLKSFRTWIDSLGVRAKFSNAEDLGWKVSQALSDWKARHAELHTPPRAKMSVRSKQPTIPPAYRDWLQRQCADLDLLGVGLQQGHAVKLNHVYVPLITSVAEEESLRQGRAREQPQLLLEQLDKHSLYVPGDPGTGKSTFCRWVAWLVAVGSLPPAAVAAPQGYVEPFPQSLAPRLPLLIPLRNVWNYLPKDAGRDVLSQAELEAALGNWLNTSSPGGLDWADVTPHLEYGSALLIFDGVDEVPLRDGEGRSACYPRAMLVAGLTDAATSWQKQGNRLLVTSRPYGIDEQQAHKLPMLQAPIRELDEALQKLLVGRWFHILKDDAGEAAQTAADMVQHLAERPELAQLTANPMLLTAMCVIYDQGKRLPQDKHDLYAQIVDKVLYNRYRNDIGELEMAREHLSVVAYGMHTGAGLGQSRTTPQAETSYKDIERMIQTYHAESAVTFTGYKDALETRDELLQRSGLLLSRGDKKAGYYHFTFQDFLAARRLADIERERLFATFCERAETKEWRNTLSFLFSSELATSREQATRLLNRIVEQITHDTIGLAVVAADCLETMLGRDNRLRADVEEKFKSICLAAIDHEVEVQARQTLGLALGRLGDPRIVTDLRDRSAYVEIPADEYAYQDGKQKIDQPFLLSKYPVTNNQFAMFVADGGYTQPKHWSKEGWKWKEEKAISAPRHWRDARFNAPNQPVVGVSFYEAEAFCQWAGGFLPTEQQWEAAARGREGLEYPWGPDWVDGICNSIEAGLGVTSPVGLFPGSRSRDFGLEDMAGNVWEWCNSPWSPGHRGRVLRGGSFYSFALDVRSAYRFNVIPDARFSVIGFRVARTYN